MRIVSEKGYAKINLHLDVTGIMENGFHSVRTVMQTIDIYDEITLSEKEEGDKTISISCDREGVPSDEKNLTWRAARAYLDRIGTEMGIHIHIAKKIPMAAGMAGGSADAAATLRGINRLCDNALNVTELCAIGGSLGSDIPFCIVGGSVIAEGKGDIMLPFVGFPAGTLLVTACGGEGVSTPWAYKRLDEVYGFGRKSEYVPKDITCLKKALFSGDVMAAAENMYNIFESVVLPERETAAKIKRILEENGAIRAMMSGSGPSIFGIFDSLESAERAASAIKAMGIFAGVTVTR
ncbi:MAG: 4-(cytidine 5'-diphospho)-2-C-methyl-D-erythritol kinase [Clostridia bacterium]|nr:4-(cytidine 5'-diphospho)-2-C-methyl-D-erythritol kinase [Clostridia bacterium]